MLTHSKALWRIEYKADLTNTGSEVLPLGFALEARWSNDVRWLGMLFRKRLLPLEADLVNFDTWPELRDPDKFMNVLFEKTWDTDIGTTEERPTLGSNLLARSYSGHGSLSFAVDDPSINLDNEDPEQSFTSLYDRLLKQHPRLAPIIRAPVVPFPLQKPAMPLPPPRSDVKQVILAA